MTKEQLQKELNKWVKTLEKSEIKNDIKKINKSIVMIQYYESRLDDFWG